MRVPEDVLSDATRNQRIAAQCPDSVVRLVAGPGSGKSRVIRDRVLWLMEQGITPTNISVASFTRASAADLERDLGMAWSEAGLEPPSPVRVSTLHALALRILRAAGQLNAFPVSPRVLDAWEMGNIFDTEFQVVSGQRSKTRRKNIRLDQEAFWSTGEWLPPGLPAPDPPISEEERAIFQAFYRSRSSLYCYLLPSDITRRCLEYLQAMPQEVGLPVQVQHLVVDEYQDLNPVDLALIHEIQQRQTILFVAGDDDQSIYFFRYAMPAGIQRFEDTYPQSTSYSLDHCFRCPTEILDPSLALMSAYAPDERIPKDYVSVPSLAAPRVIGRLARWHFRGWRREADAIAISCRGLIDAGMPAAEIAVLLSSRPALERGILQSLDAANVPYELGDQARFSDETGGRAAYSIARLGLDRSDCVALRTIIGVQDGIGPGTCDEIAAWLLSGGGRYDSILSAQDLDALGARAQRAIETALQVIDGLSGFQPDSLLEGLREPIEALVRLLTGPEAATSWQRYAEELPGDMTLEELRDLLACGSPRAERTLLNEIRDRLGFVTDHDSDDGIHVMTLHGSKGLTFDVGFIPGLEHGLLPNENDMTYPGLVQQAARVLYVGMTRARLLTVLSLAQYRLIQGRISRREPTLFVGNLSGRFESRDSGLETAEVAAVMDARAARETP